MAETLDTLVKDARSFLNALAENNTRDWFLNHKDQYERDLKHPALALLDTVAAPLEKQTGQVPSTKLFRPQRDVRFSKDKTPYHIHLHMLWSTPPTAFFFGIGRDYLSVGCGLMRFDKDTLTHWRAAVDSAKGPTIQSEVDRLIAANARIDKPELKRVPAPYDKDHARAELLRRKSLTVWFDLLEDNITKDGLVATLEATFQKLQPLNAMLSDL